MGHKYQQLLQSPRFLVQYLFGIFSSFALIIRSARFRTQLVLQF